MRGCIEEGGGGWGGLGSDPRAGDLGPVNLVMRLPCPAVVALWLFGGGCSVVGSHYGMVLASMVPGARLTISRACQRMTPARNATPDTRCIKSRSLV